MMQKMFVEWKESVLLYLYEHLNTEGTRTHVAPSEIRKGLSNGITEKYLARVIESLVEDGTVVRDPDYWLFTISNNGLLEVEIALGEGGKVPASDRSVSLNHNQILTIEKPIDDVLVALTADNGDPDSPGLRERLIGQIKAGLELIRAGEFRLYLLQVTLIQALSELIAKYKNPSIVALANALLGALVGQIVQAS